MLIFNPWPIKVTTESPLFLEIGIVTLALTGARWRNELMSSLGMRLTRRTRRRQESSVARTGRQTHNRVTEAKNSHKHTTALSQTWRLTDTKRPAVITLLLCCLSTYFTSVRVSIKFRNGAMSFLSLLVHSLVFFSEQQLVARFVLFGLVRWDVSYYSKKPCSYEVKTHTHRWEITFFLK